MELLTMAAIGLAAYTFAALAGMNRRQATVKVVTTRKRDPRHRP